MTDLLEFIITPLLSDKEALQIKESRDDFGTATYTITVDPVDYGMVIGKRGKIIRAIRTAARVRAIQDHTNVTIRLDSENDSFIKPSL